jgi:hypothetical protein
MPARSWQINISPKDAASLTKLVAYLNQTGSGNETATDLLADGRLTMMFCAFE